MLCRRMGAGYAGDGPFIQSGPVGVSCSAAFDCDRRRLYGNDQSVVLLAGAAAQAKADFNKLCRCVCHKLCNRNPVGSIVWNFWCFFKLFNLLSAVGFFIVWNITFFSQEDQKCLKSQSS